MKKKKRKVLCVGQRIVSQFSIDKRLLHFKREQKLKEQLFTLSKQKESAEELYKKYIAKKVTYFFKGVAVLILLVFCMGLVEEKDALLGNSIVRNGYGELEKGITLIAKSEGIEEEIEVSIEARHYTKNELDIMADEAFQILSDNVFLKENVTQKNGVYIVKQHLDFPLEIMDYPFSVTWESSNYDVLDENGQVKDSISENGEDVCVTAKLSCYEYVWEKEYSLQVFPVTKNWKDSFTEEITKAIEEADTDTSYEETLILPSEVNGHQIIYEEKSDNSKILIICIGFIVLALALFSMDSVMFGQIEERNKQLLFDYAKLVSKLSLYLGTGVSLRTALTRILQSEDKTRVYIRELEVTLRELNNGITESEAIDKFAKRCKLPCYIKLGVLINQNIKKGSNQLCEQLKLEAQKAFEERKNLARKYGEEAGTKLLFPMLLMLVVVMVIIMYPAFVSFTV